MPDRAQPTHSGDLVTDTPEFTLEELCSACGLSMEQITTYTEHGIIEAHGSRQSEWRFSHVSIIRLRRAKRLERDLGLNAAGVALVLDLMAEIESLKSRLIRLERMNNDNNSRN